MDVFAHGLWTTAATKAVNNKLWGAGHKSLNVWLTAFWGVFPDLFAFTIPFAWIASGLLFGNLHFSDIPRPHQIEPPSASTHWVLTLAQQLYNISHSGIVFAAAFLLVWLIARRPWEKEAARPAGEARPIPWELGGWLLHIFIDIPTHSYKFFPTPIFWPLSGWKFIYGFSWSEPWFMILNYSALTIVYYLLWRKKKSAATQ